MTRFARICTLLFVTLLLLPGAAANRRGPECALSTDPNDECDWGVGFHDDLGHYWGLTLEGDTTSVCVDILCAHVFCWNPHLWTMNQEYETPIRCV